MHFDLEHLLSTKHSPQRLLLRIASVSHPLIKNEHIRVGLSVLLFSHHFFDFSDRIIIVNADQIKVCDWMVYELVTQKPVALQVALRPDIVMVAWLQTHNKLIRRTQALNVSKRNLGVEWSEQLRRQHR
jgi:hypothetical protein